jgi:hypothetical protein
MNKNWSRFLALAIAILSVVSGILLLPRSKPDRIQPVPEFAPVPSANAGKKPQAKLPTIRRNQFSGDDMADFTNRFEKRFKPEIARWCKVYEGRLPFNATCPRINKTTTH